MSKSIIALVVLFSLFYSCDYIKSIKSFKEGVIEYSIAYNDSLSLKIDPKLRPDKMIIKYNGKNVLNRIEALSGTVSLTFIQNADQQIYIALIKLFNKKLYYQEPMSNGEFNIAFGEMPKVSVVETNEVVSFLGYKCKKAVATFADSLATSFDVIYIEDVDIENPNQNTPFELIDGILLKFRVKLFQHDMTISATNVKQKNVSLDEFVVPADYEKVDKQTVYDVIYLLK